MFVLLSFPSRLSTSLCGVRGRDFRVRLTENMKRSGYFSKSLFRIVLLPVPLGPEMTIGCGFFSLVGVMVVLRYEMTVENDEEGNREDESLEREEQR